MSYLVDTDWLINAFGGARREAEVIDRLESAGLAVSIITLGEFYEGAFYTAEPWLYLVGLRRYVVRFGVVDLSDPVMEIFARIRAELRNQGQLIPDLDLLIASTAIAHNLTQG